MNAPSRLGRQRGAALIVVMILLLVMAWFALSGFRVSGQHLQIVGNSQARTQAQAAAQRAIEETLSSNAFALDPKAVAATPIETDVDGDGTPDFTAHLDPAPKCYRVRPIKTAELDIAKKADRVCLNSSDAGGTQVIDRPGAAVASGDSLCAATEWNVAARVDDQAGEVATEAQQGVAIRVAKSDAANFCK